MTRLSFEELEKVKEKYNVPILWSWSRVSSYTTSPYEYYLKYILHKKEDISNCAYAPCGSLAHDCLERFYNGEITKAQMLENFEDGWIMNIDIADLKFDRNDKNKNDSIKTKYKYDIEHFLKHHEPMADKVITEKFVTAKIGPHVLQGYIDATYKDENGNFCIIDFKTSTKFSGKNLEEKSGQLTVYAIALNQLGVPFDKIRIGFNMLKYCTITYRQKNGTVKTRDVERYKVGESLQTNARMWLKDAGYGNNGVNDYLKMLIDTNDINVLPDEVRCKYSISDCFVWVPLTQKLIDKWTNDIESTINHILNVEKEYNKTYDEKLWWDSDEQVKNESFYFSTLSGYSASLHKPYAQYLKSIEEKKNANVFDVTKPQDDEDDLAWLDALL